MSGTTQPYPFEPFFRLLNADILNSIFLGQTPVGGLTTTGAVNIGGEVVVTGGVTNSGPTSATEYKLSGSPFISSPTSTSLGPTTLLGLGAGKGLGWAGGGAQGTVAIGFQAGGGAGPGMTGNENTMIGWNAGGNVTTGSFCTYIGLNAGGLTTTDNNNTMLGNDAFRNATGAGNIGIGVPVMRNGTYTSCVAIGGMTQNGNDAATSSGNIVIGIGALSGTAMTTSNNNVIIGTNAAATITSASSNIIIGTNAGNTITTGLANTFVGHQTGQTTTTQQNCTFIGNVAGKSLGGQSITAIGSGALGGASGGANSTLAVGANTGNKTTGANNTLLGTGVASVTLTSGTGNIFIGCSTTLDAGAAGESHTLRIGDHATNVIVSTAINTATPATQFNGTFGFNVAPIAKPTVTGSKGANAALASLLTALSNYGLITDSSS